MGIVVKNKKEPLNILNMHESQKNHFEQKKKKKKRALCMTPNNTLRNDLLTVRHTNFMLTK